ncbi:phosphatidylinositol-binding clathrin assembly protein LAP-like [Hydractinia symbiolongicarpus]|uniref:phosphatidylinositol-binding clathrin assembly protein LAP-like n=1 Tax=Hydractinia symbiolongicarpus TaxID=13093 RepID=UPI00254C1A5B|nr:phosphatidylinositol-binding clathrin assembly protein LAP-like [Hydractinia symbiolongicarpus]
MNVKDRVESAKHTITGSNLGKAVSKATSHEVIGPKKKHISYLQNALEFDNVSIPDIADSLFERCNNSSWVVVFKSLVTFHHLMSNANERFIQYVASRSTTWMLHNFLDKGGVQGYDMSHAIRRYSAYLAEKAYAYRAMGYDFCRVARGKEAGVLRNMEAHKLLKALPAIQVQLDSLIATEIASNDLTNGVITAAFMALFKDLIKLFACYNDGIINLLEKYFEMKKSDCKVGLEIYKRFLARMERVSEFLKIAEDAGINKGEIPDLTKAPNSLLAALEQHYQSLEKGKAGSPPTNQVTLAAFNVGDQSQNNFTPTPQDDYLLEQKRMLEMYESNKKREDAQKFQKERVLPAALSGPQKNPVSLPVQQTQQFVLTEQLYTQPQKPRQVDRPSDDLLLLSAPPLIASTGLSNTQSFDQLSYHQNSSGMGIQYVDFNQAFASNQSTSSPNLMDILIPEENSSTNVVASNNAPDDRLTGDLNKGIERMAMSLDGLNVNPATLKANTMKGHQWTNQQPAIRTGGQNFQMSGIARSTLPPAGFAQAMPISGGLRCPQTMPPFSQTAQYGYAMQQPSVYGYQTMTGQSQMNQIYGLNQQQFMMSSNMSNEDPFKLT